MWDFFETVRHRHSVRKFRTDIPIEPEKLHAILEMACAAPSAGDLQAYRIVVVRDAQHLMALSNAAGHQTFIAEAPLCLIFCSDAQRSGQKYGDRGRDLYTVQDTTIAATYAQLAIVAAGLASTWIGAFDEAAVAKVLGLEAGLKPLALLSVGYAAELPESTPRRPLRDVVTYL